ncbi:PH domain-containing protein [Macrococcus lamae]|nr:PH domain-containing protein [Macrococcus lamae]
MKSIDPAAVKVWRIAAGIFTAIILLITLSIWLLKTLYFDWIPYWVIGVLLAVLVLQFTWFVLIEPVIGYKTYQYKIDSDELIIFEGIYIKKRHLIPFARIQNVETTVGPIMKRFGLKTVEITTAGGGAAIHLIEDGEAEKIKQEISEVIKRLERRRWQ